jgi:hypothetical protein
LACDVCCVIGRSVVDNDRHHAHIADSLGNAAKDIAYNGGLVVSRQNNNDFSAHSHYRWITPNR